MNKTTEALKLAEEALDELRYANDTDIAKTKYYKALAAIRKSRADQDHIADADKVIAEPANTRSTSEYSEPANTRSASEYSEPVKQEPIGEVDPYMDFLRINWKDGRHPPKGTKLYAAPVSAKREWVDLTDDELKAALEVHQVGLSVRIGRIAIAAFKENNK